MNATRTPVTFSFTAETNALDYLEEGRRFIERAATQPAAWKWVVIALHGALYGFAITACRGTTNDRVVKIEKKTGQERLIRIGEAIRMTQDPKVMATIPVGQAVVMTKDQKESVRELSQIFRNRFEHHIPGDWTFFDDNFRPMCRNVIEVLRLIVHHTGQVVLWPPGDRERFDQLVTECSNLLS